MTLDRSVFVAAAGRFWPGLVLVIGACGSDPDSACPGERPGIDECESGRAFAECGGIAEPRFACRDDTGDCLWFTGGCIAKEYDVASDCPPNDLCCHDSWVFDERRSAEFTAMVSGYLFNMGTLPWDRERAMTLDVSFDSSIASQELSVQCDPDPGSDPFAAPTPCRYADFLERDVASTFYAVFGPLSTDIAVSGYQVWLEVDVGEMRARACQQTGGDVIGACNSGSDRVCADSGSVVLSGDPRLGAASDVAVRLEAHFPDGMTMTAAF